MRIANNIMAMNAHRQLVVNQDQIAKSIEKLSSGLRINRAGDDAAGLAISEKMRGQIRGLKMAMKNAQDAISLIQTAEGALQETHAILQRMRELAAQAASDTNTATDRFEIQKEINQLVEELTRIGNTTEFNTMKLLDGKFSGKFHIGANSGQNIDLAIADMRAESLKVVAETAVWVADPGTTGFVASTGNSGIEGLVGGTYKVEVDDQGNVSLRDESGKEIASATVSVDGGVTLEVSDANYIADPDATEVKITLNIPATLIPAEDAEDGDDNNGTVVTKPGTISLYVLQKGQGISVMNQQDADKAITAINNAIERVSAERSKLGAYQNRLEHTIANLGTSAENLQAAESRIRDVDMAAEMMTFTKFQILQQASTAMLAQANLAPQSVLQLLG
nr:flagellin [Bacillota bacterium]